MTACCAASRLDFSLGIPPLPVRRGTGGKVNTFKERSSNAVEANPGLVEGGWRLGKEGEAGDKQMLCL